MSSPTKTTEMQGRNASATGRPTPMRKQSNRPTMNKKSSYKRPTRASKSTAKQYSTAKKLASIRRSSGKIPTREEKITALARAREWAKNRLGRKNSLPVPQTPVDSSRIIVIDDDDAPFVGHDMKKSIAKSDTCNKQTKRCGDLHQHMLELDIESQEMKKTAAGNLVDQSKEDIFYDALEFLPTEPDVDIEDVSDEEDDEIRDLRSARRNGVPSVGQWMEPLEPDGISYSTFAPKYDP
mmetsp:Transcript_2184/g.4012  ORF Transcript_2184/g.4012 Transcript_2184/m.4012 type:complete len:238 (+) Transcript_2184:1907-2620(+)|eukprot:CAMPEP_0196159410 /NCGR_PEP_ID=MMETSP0910-20130528/46306_1 /TAXON_ID=49265 /ORGANISM="Thalassiosira rotula, Strain GSO102" /LENGTH=237 /DNA_ID=CAMNT_0041424329 /DNA_START=1830 /DNA_END=2543 /DNA_ORIENTATION=+